jgi:hypothetical protein
MRMICRSSLIGIVAIALAPLLLAQRAPAIPGHTGTLVTPETAKDEKKAEDKAAVAVKDLVTHEAKGPLSDLVPGSTVVIRHGTDVTEATVAKVDVGANEITVRFADKRVQKLVLADRGAADARTVEYTDDLKQRVTRYFRPKS